MGIGVARWQPGGNMAGKTYGNEGNMKKWLIRIAVGFGAIVAGLVVVFFAVNYYMAPSEATLRPHLVGTTRIVVRSGGLCHRSPELEKTLFIVDDTKVINELIKHIQTSKFAIVDSCACCGNPTFEFYRGSELLAGLSFHHGHSLRWDGWDGDGQLTEASSLYLITLLKNHGLTDQDFQ